MTDQKTQKDPGHGGVEQRVWMHWKSMKGYLQYNIDWVDDGPTPGGLVHGHYKPTTPNHVWLHLARVHKMKVRRVKDIINARRNPPASSTTEEVHGG